MACGGERQQHAATVVAVDDLGFVGAVDRKMDIDRNCVCDYLIEITVVADYFGRS